MSKSLNQKKTLFHKLCETTGWENNKLWLFSYLAQKLNSKFVTYLNVSAKTVRFLDENENICNIWWGN